MILESRQQVQAAEQKNQPEFCFAVVAGVHQDGISLYIGAETTPTQKHYKCNTTCKFAAGQKVYIQKAGGEYVVLFPIGNPATEIVVDRATRATTAETAKKAETANSATVAQELKNTDTNYGNIRLQALYTNELQYQIKGYEWIKLQNQ